MTLPSLPPILVLMGPTASGKTALAVQLAQRLNGEIISVDSALVYRGMDIGTAKPTLAERGGIPHHLIDILDPSEAFSTGQFRRTALDLMADITRRDKLPVLVGGTMLYFNALLQGLARLPPANPAIRAQLDQDLLALGKDAMHARLAAVDPIAASRIHPNDPQRIQRALEIYLLSGQAMSQFWLQAAQTELPYQAIKLVVAPTERATLHHKIAARFKQMLSDGLVDEVKALQARGDLDVSLPAIRAVGYRQVWDYLHGDCDFAAMQEKGIIATRQLAKRQFTWLRKQTDAMWFASDDPDLLNNVLSAVSRLMNCR